MNRIRSLWHEAVEQDRAAGYTDNPVVALAVFLGLLFAAFAVPYVLAIAYGVPVR